MNDENAISIGTQTNDTGASFSQNRESSKKDEKKHRRLAKLMKMKSKKVLDLDELEAFIGAALASKMRTDAIDDKANHQRDTLPEHVVDIYLRTLGTVSEANKALTVLAHSIRKRADER